MHQILVSCIYDNMQEIFDDEYSKDTWVVCNLQFQQLTLK